MGVLERLWRTIRANVNSLVSQAEDPERILEQTVMDLQQELITMRQAVAQAIATQKRVERQMAQNQTLAEQWRQRAQLALEKEEENLAREALVRRQSYQKTAQALQAQIEQEKDVIGRLKKDMRTLESKIAELKNKKDMYIARARSAAASQKIRELTDNIDTGGALGAFERMQEKVLQLEAQSEVIGELGTDDLEKKFSALEGANGVEAQLTQMKANRLPARELSAQDSEIDREIEQLRSPD